MMQKFRKHYVSSLVYPFLLVNLVGCALYGPDYKKPSIVTPKNWQSTPTKDTQLSNTSVSDIAWWNKFNDPVLNNLIQEALINNNDIQIGVGNIVVAAGQLKQVNMSFVPTISLSAMGGFGESFNSSSSSSNPMLSPFIASSSSSQGFNFYSFGLTPSYTLNILQQLRTQDVAKANMAMAKSAKNAIRLGVISQVVGSYFTLLALDAQKELQQKLITSLSQLVELLNISLKHGLITTTDMLPYEQNLAQAKIQLPIIIHNISATQNALQALINKNPDKIIRGRKFSDLLTDGIIPVNLPSMVLANRPDIVQAEEQLKLANANIGVATSNFFPSIALTSPVGGFNNQLKSLFSQSGDYWATRVSLFMPILNLGINGLIKQSKGQYYVAYYNYVKTVRNAFVEVDNSLSNYTQEQKTMEEVNKLYDITYLSNNSKQINYKNGYISYVESLSSEANLNSVSMQVIQTKLQKLQSIIMVYQAMAGGYNYSNYETPKKFGDSHDSDRVF